MTTIFIEMFSALIVVIFLSLVLNFMAEDSNHTQELLDSRYPEPKKSFLRRFWESIGLWFKDLTFGSVITLLIAWGITLLVYFLIRLVSSIILLII